MAGSSGNVPSSSQGVAGSSGNVPGSSQGVPGESLICLLLPEAISNQDLQGVKDFLKGRQVATISWIDAFQTPLQEACSCDQLEIIKKLLLHKMKIAVSVTAADTNYRQSLELDIAAGDGNVKIFRTLCKNKTNLFDQKYSASCYGLAIPVLRASNAGHREVTRYLYYNHYKGTLPPVDPNDVYWATCLLLDAIFYGFLDIALDIITYLPSSSVALTKQASQRSTPLKFLALKPDLFPSHCNLGFWRGLIYSCIRISETSRANRENRTTNFCLKWFGIKQICDLKDRHCKAHSLLQNMCTSLRDDMAKNEIGYWKETVCEALLEAVKNGNKEFFIEIIKCDPRLLWISKATSGRNLFQLAVEFKKEKIFNLIHGLEDIKVGLLRSYDKENNNILHIAAHLSSPDQLSKISGAALKMQREIQWFKEVKSLVSEREVVQKNNKDKTPREIFEEFHETLRKEGEEWMKYTATACSFVAALIATVTFQAIFTPPGGTDETSGSPLLLHDLHFIGFIFTDTLAFFASCISVLIFLSILTSRYSFDDFIVSLPRKMILGQSILFISIASMLVAFITSLSASMRHRPTLVVPLKPLASFPSILFLMLQYPLLKEMISSTYGKRLFYRDTKNWLQ